MAPLRKDDEFVQKNTRLLQLSGFGYKIVCDSITIRISFYGG